MLILLLQNVASARPRAVLAALDLDASATPALRARAKEQIEQGLAATGYDVVSAAPLSIALAGCRTSGCMRDIGSALGVNAILIAAVIPRGESSAIELHLFDGQTGVELARLNELCDLCGESELVEHLGIAASAVRARAAVPSEPRPSSIVPGIATGAAGAAMIGVSVYLLRINGRGACGAGDTPVYPDPNAVIRYPDPSNHDDFVCRDLYRTEAAGIVGLGLGAAAVALGTVLIVRARHQSIQLVPSSTGASLAMAFAW